MTEEQVLHLNKLLELNRKLNIVYVSKDDLKRQCDCKDRRDITCLLIDWIQSAEESGVKALKDSAVTLSR